MDSTAWALGLSIAAILIAGWSAWSAHRLAKGDRARRRHELTPDLTATGLLLGTPEGKRLYAAVIRNNGPQDLDEVTVELVDRKHGSVTGLRSGPKETYAPRILIGRLRLGEGKVVDCERRSAGDVRLRVEAKSGADEWNVLLEFSWPPEPFAFI